MRDDGDFTAYAEARWPTLVRTSVLLGSPVPAAVEIAEATLVRCRMDWRSISEAGDLDVEVYAELLDQRSRTPATDPVRDPVADPDLGAAAGAADDSEAALLLVALVEALGRLDDGDRRAVVLRHGAGLSPVQAAEVLGIDELEVEERLARAMTLLDVEGLVQRCR